MASHPGQQFLLKRKNRGRRRELLTFLEAIELYLLAGYDLSFAWREAKLALKPGDFKTWVEEGGDTETEMGLVLSRFAREYPVAGHRIWFQVLRELVGRGASLGPTLAGFIAALHAETQREVASHARVLPMQLNLLLLIFFLPSTLALVLIPLLIEFIESF